MIVCSHPIGQRSNPPLDRRRRSEFLIPSVFGAALVHSALRRSSRQSETDEISMEEKTNDPRLSIEGLV